MIVFFRWIPADKLRSGETTSSAFDSLRSYVRKPHCKDGAKNNVNYKLRKNINIPADYDKDGEIIIETSKRMSKLPNNWFPNYWLTFYLASLPAGSKCQKAFGTSTIGNNFNNVSSNCFDTPPKKRGRAEVRGLEKIKRAKLLESPAITTSSTSSASPQTGNIMRHILVREEKVISEDQQKEIYLKRLTNKIL